MSDEGQQIHSLRTLRTRLRRVGPIVGIVLLVAALVMVWMQRHTVGQALEAISDRDASDLVLHLGALLATIVINVICTAAMFNLLLRRHGRVGWIEMQSLIAGSTLLNYIPLRPGLFGRVAYHRLYNDIAVSDSVKAIVQAIALSFVCVALLGAAVSVTWRSERAMWFAAIAPLATLILVTSFLLFVPRRSAMWPLTAAGAVRYVDLLTTAVRYQIAFALLGAPIEFTQAAALACVAVIATMVPFLSNGLGLREWAVGLAAPILAASQIELAITADLLNRAAEIIVIVPLGLAGIVHLAQLRRRRSGGGEGRRGDTVTR